MHTSLLFYASLPESWCNGKLFNALKSPKLWKLCVQNVCCNKGYSRNKCLSIVMKLTGYLLSELSIVLSINPKYNIIIFPDCPEIQGSKLRLCFPYSFHFWIFHIRNYLSSNSILDLYREFKKWKGQSSLPAQAKIWATDFRTVCVQNTNLGKILRCILD